MNSKRQGIGKHMAAAIWLILLCIKTPQICQAHSVDVHAEIANSAVLSSEGFGRFLSDNSMNADSLLLFDSIREIPMVWVAKGAVDEDKLWRFGNHFYTVKPNRVAGQAGGLNDASESLGILPLPIANSYRWATKFSILEREIADRNASGRFEV